MGKSKFGKVNKHVQRQNKELKPNGFDHKNPFSFQSVKVSIIHSTSFDQIISLLSNFIIFFSRVFYIEVEISFALGKLKKTAFPPTYRWEDIISQRIEDSESHRAAWEHNQNRDTTVGAWMCWLQCLSSLVHSPHSSPTVPLSCSTAANSSSMLNRRCVVDHRKYMRRTYCISPLQMLCVSLHGPKSKIPQHEINLDLFMNIFTLFFNPSF